MFLNVILIEKIYDIAGVILLPFAGWYESLPTISTYQDIFAHSQHDDVDGSKFPSNNTGHEELVRGRCCAHPFLLGQGTGTPEEERYCRAQ